MAVARSNLPPPPPPPMPPPMDRIGETFATINNRAIGPHGLLTTEQTTQLGNTYERRRIANYVVIDAAHAAQAARAARAAQAAQAAPQAPPRGGSRRGRRRSYRKSYKRIRRSHRKK